MKRSSLILLGIAAISILGCKKISKKDLMNGCMYCTVNISAHKGCAAQAITYQYLYDHSVNKATVDLCKFYDSLRARPFDQCGNPIPAGDITIDCP